MEKSISKRTERQFGAEADAVRKRADTYRGNMSLRDIEESIQDANNELRNFYKRQGTTDSPVGPQMAATQAEVQALRKLLDQKVEELSGEGVAPLKREYGALRDVERATAKAQAVATRQKGATLWEGLAALHAAGDFLTGNALGAAKGVGVLAIGKRLKNLRDPSYLIDKAFQGDKAFPAAEPIPPHAGPPPPKGLLPKPATPMSGPPDTSGPVPREERQGSRWVTPKAALPEEKPIAAQFVREIPKGKKAATPFSTKGLLPSGEPPATTIPPLVDEKFAREETRPLAGNEALPAERQLGTAGRGGVRTTPKAALPEKKQAQPLNVYRAHDAGKTDVDLEKHAHATGSKKEAQAYAQHRNQGTPQKVSRIDVSKWKPEDVEEMEGPRGNKWYRFKRQPKAEEYEPEE